MPKYNIITCDLCGDRIYKSGIFEGNFKGAVKISAKVLKKDFKAIGKDRSIFMYPNWRRRKYYFCAKCVNTIRNYCLKHLGGEEA